MTVVLDTSAVGAVVLGEPDAEHFARILVANAGDILLGTATYVEAAIVLQARLGDDGPRALDELCRACGVEVIALDAEQAELAVLAWKRFGRGRHQARLNFGDCFAYALARARSAPLLYKGSDFSQTDIAAA